MKVIAHHTIVINIQLTFSEKPFQYEISGKTSNRYPFNGQMCPVNKFKPVEVIFVDRKNGIPEMAAF